MGPIAMTLRPAPAVHLRAPYPENMVFPLSLAASRPDTHIAQLIATIQELLSNEKLRTLSDEHGAVYFQNPGSEKYVGNPVRRAIHSKNVAMANEGPNTQPVHPHNESGLSPHYPAYVLFFCASPPDTGSEIPINHSIVLYRLSFSRHPDFIKDLKCQ
ncbi:uncharacterized protein GLRG_11602 [Colletotrichum graminicola M1.001]|uniref:Uncharacterized protein n=1 Tax=Colletotrichum graminicola (strain M1.001 / M2 / FGSC 10212) TaxID=645133 RepID=E3R013_COLGM|nr:uncharacterized protein GLRG_11602 [Colletotrichum graminicola M1.001]EFQ36457.1 hypothetical protein GLRG_11602 [Colletotrichum graminicola M1.001]